MFERRYRWNEVPAVSIPGVYAFYACEQDALSPVILGPDCLIYIGMTEDSLEVRNHFQHKQSGFSTLRRSLGALLKERLDLIAIPRAPGQSETNIDCYRFTADGEAALSRWMQAHLSLAIEPLESRVAQTEADLIAAMEPPLCLTRWRNPQKQIIQELRNKCKAEARRNRTSSPT